MRYDYKTINTPIIGGIPEADLQRLGADGWELVAVKDGGRAYLKRPAQDARPSGIAKACANCRHFSLPSGVKEASADSSGWCGEWKLAMTATGTCGQFSERPADVVAEKVNSEIPGANVKLPAGAIPDEDSPWHWQPQTDLGEKRIEAVTDLVGGVLSPPHKHRVIVIARKDGAVVRGKTDMVNGHFHTVTILGVTDEADAHTHIFSTTEKG